MKLIDLQLERYDMYRDTSWQPPEKGLCIITGENESGKTTMLRFIRDMLFGYRRGRRKGKQGNLSLCLANGRVYRIYRNEGETRLVDDRNDLVRGEPAELWWHGLDRKTYEQVFAVDLDDLQGAELLAKDDVRSRFLSMQGGERLASGQQQIETAMESLLVGSPQGKRKLNLLLNRREEVEKKIREMAAQETDFAALQREQKAVAEDIAHTEEALASVDTRDRTMDRQLGAWRQYEEGAEIKRRLDLCSTISAFPADGKERWNHLMQRMAEIKARRDELAAKMEPLAPQARETVVPWEPWREEIAALYMEGRGWEERAAELAENDAAYAEWEAEFAATGNSLARWRETDYRRLQNVDWPAGQALARQMRQRDDELHFWRNDEPKCEITETIDAADVPPVTTEEEFAEWDDKGRRMLALVREKEQLREEIDYLAAQPVQRYSAFFWLGFLLLAPACYAFWLYFTGGLGAEALYMVGGFLLISLLCFYVNKRRSQRHGKRLEKLRERLTQAEAEQHAIAERIGLGIPTTAEEVAHFVGELETLRRDFYRYRTKLQAIAWQEESCRLQAEQHAEWEARGAKLQQDAATTTVLWQEWLKANGLPLIPAAELEDLRAEWQTLFTAKGQGEILRVRREKLRAQLAELEQRTAQVLAACGVEAEPTPAATVLLASGYREQTLAWQTVQERNAQYRELAREKALVDERWQLCEREMQALLDLVDAKNAAEFADKVSAYEACDRLRAEYEHIRQNLRLYAGSEAEFLRLWTQLETGEYKQWLERRDQYERSAREYRDKLSALRQRQGALASELQRLAADDSLSKLLQERTLLDAEIRTAVDEYIALVFARKIIERSRSAYEAGAKPAVVERAGGYLRRMTDGRYDLRVDSDGRVYTYDAANEYKTAEQWSSGTGDQVYLALRLALALAFAERTEDMPIVLDDIFVRFDERRQRETLRFLFEFSRNRQVFLFTCHANTARLAREADSRDEGHYYRLEAGRVFTE
ncbi:MAG: AAA family ATPase [Veillonellaceae bacterium]|nr:AAA family ATPase [Veillonellaceae bacterium]